MEGKLAILLSRCLKSVLDYLPSTNHHEGKELKPLICDDT